MAVERKDGDRLPVAPLGVSVRVEIDFTHNGDRAARGRTLLEHGLEDVPGILAEVAAVPSIEVKDGALRMRHRLGF